MLMKSWVPDLEVLWVGNSVRAMLQQYGILKKNGKYWFAQGELLGGSGWEHCGQGNPFFLSSCLVDAWSFVKKFATVWCTHCGIKDKLWCYWFRTVSLLFESLLRKKSPGFFSTVSLSPLWAAQDTVDLSVDSDFLKFHLFLFNFLF